MNSASGINFYVTFKDERLLPRRLSLEVSYVSRCPMLFAIPKQPKYLGRVHRTLRTNQGDTEGPNREKLATSNTISHSLVLFYYTSSISSPFSLPTQTFGIFELNSQYPLYIFSRNLYLSSEERSYSTP